MNLDETLSQSNKTHRPLYTGLEKAIADLKERFIAKGDFSYITLEQMSIILEDLASFPLGRHILLAGGSNGMWTDYLISPEAYLADKSHTDLDLSVIERFFLFSSPAVLAQRELHKKLQITARNFIREGKTLASIPCGLMRDLLSLDYSNTKGVSLFGIDIDPDSIQRSKILASSKNAPNTEWIQQNAWDLEFKDRFDFIGSVGLNVYENNKEKVIQLYKNFYAALKPGGVFFTGVLTWPPYLDKEKSDWDVSLIPKFDMYLETVIHRDILNIQWFNFRTLEEIKNDFQEAGFTNIKIEKDSKGIFPAVIAVK